MSKTTVEDQRVSIIVPVYNAAQFLDKSISSLIRQTHKTIEIILIDDGSTDDSLQKCREYEEQDSRVRVLVHENNMGLEAARNSGINVLSGQWVMFLDADDEYVVDAVEQMVKFASINNLDLALAPFFTITDGIKKLYEADLAEGVYSKREFASACLTKIPMDVITCVGAKIYRADFLRDNSILFDPYYKYNEDGGFITTCLSLAENVGYCFHPFYLYLIRKSGSIQSSYREKMYGCLARMDDFFEQYLCMSGDYSEKQITAMVSKKISTASASLQNELRFGSYKSYVNTIKQIRESFDFEEAISAKKINIKQKAILYIIQNNLHMLLFCFFKMRNILK